MSNMTLDDLLDALAHWGSVSIRRTRFPSAASENLKGNAVEWHLEIRIPGYANEYGQPRFTAQGPSIRDIAEALYAETETFLFSGQGKAARKKYVDDLERHNAAAERLNPGDRSSYLPRQRKPAVPDVIGSDAPSIETETYQ